MTKKSLWLKQDEDFNILLAVANKCLNESAEVVEDVEPRHELCH